MRTRGIFVDRNISKKYFFLRKLQNSCKNHQKSWGDNNPAEPKFSVRVQLNTIGA